MNTLAYLGFGFEEAGRLYLRRFEKRTREFALEPLGCKTLLVLAENEGITQQRLADLAAVDPSTMGRILWRLEGRGLVERRSRPRDRRARAVALTREAEMMLPALWQAAREPLHEALTGVSSTERRVLADALQRVLSNLSMHTVHRETAAGLDTSAEHTVMVKPVKT